MTIINRTDEGNTKLVARRFALLAMSYLDDPKKAKSRTAKIPLQNLYRLLEMYRYDAFADEGRRGVLALDRSSAGPVAIPVHSQPKWHLQIEIALKSAVDASYAAGKEKKAALDEVEGDLQTLAKEGTLSHPRAEKVRKFLVTFESSLA